MQTICKIKLEDRVTGLLQQQTSPLRSTYSGYALDGL